jgi:hypothetical protein
MELPKVRRAGWADEEEVMAMCRRLHAENGLFSLDEDKVRTLLHYAFADPPEHMTYIGVIGETGHIEASTCFQVSGYYYTSDIHLAELWNYVQPEFRRSRNAEALIKFGKETAESLNLIFLTGIITNTQTAGKVRLYRRLVGYPAGAFFIHNAPQWKNEPMAENGDLTRQLREAAHLCHKNGIEVVRQKVPPLLRQAADVLSAENNVWESKTRNGGAVTAQET